MFSFHAIFFWPLGGCFGSLCLNLWWDEGGFFRGLQASEMRSHSLLVMFYEVYHGNSRSPSNHNLGYDVFPFSTHLNASRLIFLNISDFQDTCIIWRLPFHFAVDNLFVPESPAASLKNPLLQCLRQDPMYNNIIQHQRCAYFEFCIFFSWKAWAKNNTRVKYHDDILRV